MFRMFSTFAIIAFVFGVALCSSEAQAISKQQEKAMERRMAAITLRHKVDKSLSDAVSYQDATDCTAMYMVNQDELMGNGLAEIMQYARHLATWQSVRKRNAQKEGVEVTNISSENYCDIISVDCSSKKKTKKLLNSCAKKMRKAEKTAMKKMKAK